MDRTIVVALISLIGTIVGSLSGIVVSSKLAIYKPYQFDDKNVNKNRS